MSRNRLAFDDIRYEQSLDGPPGRSSDATSHALIDIRGVAEPICSRIFAYEV